MPQQLNPSRSHAPELESERLAGNPLLSKVVPLLTRQLVGGWTTRRFLAEVCLTTRRSLADICLTTRSLSVFWRRLSMSLTVAQQHEHLFIFVPSWAQVNVDVS